MKLHHPEPEKIKHMFSQVAKKYDTANSVLSMGIHHLWRKKLVALSEVQSGQKVLDCATGTGDLAIEFKKHVGISGEVIGTDFCAEMLQTAPDKAKKQNLDIRFEVADVTKLPFENKIFDICSISFGIRNVQNPSLGLSEMARVTQSGGTVMVLEFGQVKWPVLNSLYNFYSQKVLPQIGGWITGQAQAYEYLQNSSSTFPCAEEFCQLMMSTGLYSEVVFEPLTGGIAYIYKGRVL
jgi:demethylmenaquinone methyltransferase/2-methoxy-6-polyprenyl-1,4-benzoquinol methylase